jgi:lysophospholipase L1-like esterase
MTENIKPLSSPQELNAGVNWVRTWGASPQSPETSVIAVEPFENATLRQVVRISGGGHRVCVRISNEYGTTPLTIGAAHIGLSESSGGIVDGSDRTLTFAGQSTVIVPAGAPILSDPVDLHVPGLSHVTISLYIPDRVETCTCHGTFHTLGWIVPGDASALASLPASATLLSTQALISAVEVLPDTPTKSIAVIGDSRVDGIGSTPGTDRRWTDVLAQRLNEHGGAVLCVSNQGIGGNRMLADGIGTSALARFDRDVLAAPGLGYVVIAVGGNDIAISFAPRNEETLGFLEAFPGGPVTADDVITAHLQLAARSRAHGVKVYAATIAPYGGTELFALEGEATRQTINHWIRTSDAFDGVLDFDAVWRDPDDTTRIRDDLHMGDHLHGNDAGYEALATAIDLNLFC